MSGIGSVVEQACDVQIRLAVRYLKDVLKMKFPELRARAAAAEAERRQREVRHHSFCLLFSDDEF